jgi:hypothetical protein
MDMMGAFMRDERFFMDNPYYSITTELRWPKMWEQLPPHWATKEDGESIIFNEKYIKDLSIPAMTIINKNEIKDSKKEVLRDCLKEGIKDKSAIKRQMELADIPKPIMKESIIIAMDTETYTNKDNQVLMTIAGRSDTKYHKDNFLPNYLNKTNYDCETNVIGYFHYLKFDWHVIRTFPGFKINSACLQGGRVYGAQFRYKKKLYQLRDSYKLITCPLKDFTKAFDLHNFKDEPEIMDIFKPDLGKIPLGKLELIIYGMFTAETQGDEFMYFTIEKHNYTITDIPVYEIKNGQVFAGDYIGKKVRQYMINGEYLKFCNCYVSIEWFKLVLKINDELYKKETGLDTKFFYMDSYTEGIYYHMAHNDYYLFYDCKVLKAGIDKFDKLLLDKYDVCMHNFMTIGAIAHAIMVREGGYLGCCEVYGGMLQYIKRAVYGGRTSMGYNSKWLIEDTMIYMDAFALYPTAMIRLCEPPNYKFIKAYGKVKNIGGMGGVPTEAAKEFRNSDHFNEIAKIEEGMKTNPYYVATIKFTSNCVPTLTNFGKTLKEQQIPFTSYKQDGKIIYTNEMMGKTIEVDRNTLESWMFHLDFTFEFKYGIYWDGVPNPKMGGVMMKYHTDRNKYKSEKNSALATIIKYLANNTFGKTGQNPSTEKIVYRKLIEDDEYFQKRPNIKSWTDFGTHREFVLDENTYLQHNLQHVNCSILSMSKVIMNEVIDIFNRIGALIIYGDTDSFQVVMYDKKGRNNVYRCNDIFRSIYGWSFLPKNEKGQYDMTVDEGMPGEFHLDFACPEKETNVRALKAIICGRKAYFDLLVTDQTLLRMSHNQLETNKKLLFREYDYLKATIPLDQPDGKWYYYHYKAKGVNHDFDLQYPDVEKVYMDVLNDKCVPIDLTYGAKVSMDFNIDPNNVKLVDRWRDFYQPGEYLSDPYYMK